MRVFLVGATGNLGLRLIPALLVHKHIVTVYVRSPEKLNSLVPSSLIAELTVVVGDATDAAAIKRAILENRCDAIVNTAGNQVPPWREPVPPKIAKAIAEAAVEVGKERGGRPLRAWFIGGLISLEIPKTDHLVQDYLPKFATSQHHGTPAVLESIPLLQLRWSLLCVAMMKSASPTIAPLATPRVHSLIAKAETVAGWEDYWVRKLPGVGTWANLMLHVAHGYTTLLEDVADFLAEDLESESQQWVGNKVGIKQRSSKSPVRSLWAPNNQR